MVIGVAVTASFRQANSKQERLCAISAKQKKYESAAAPQTGWRRKKLRLGRAMMGLRLYPAGTGRKADVGETCYISDIPGVSPKINK